VKFNPNNWYSKRELGAEQFVPKHFIKCNAVVTPESEIWIIAHLSGRYAIINQWIEDTASVSPVHRTIEDIVYFEDSKEAILYELLWS
jgi:hypothetical protein